jgi:hypothetical protein
MAGWKQREGQFIEFAARVKKRLDAGHLEYGDGSFERPPQELLDEILEEIEDIMGWSFVLHCRVTDLKNKL